MCVCVCVCASISLLSFPSFLCLASHSHSRPLRRTAAPPSTFRFATYAICIAPSLFHVLPVRLWCVVRPPRLLQSAALTPRCLLSCGTHVFGGGMRGLRPRTAALAFLGAAQPQEAVNAEGCGIKTNEHDGGPLGTSKDARARARIPWRTCHSRHYSRPWCAALLTPSPPRPPPNSCFLTDALPPSLSVGAASR